MSEYRSGFSESDYLLLKAAIDWLAIGDGPFTADQVLHEVERAGVTSSRDDVVTELDDLTDLGHLHRVEGADPPQWEIATTE